MSENILLDPIPELSKAIETNLFGINPTSGVVYESSFPNTEEDRASVKDESAKTGRTPERVIARAKIGLLDGGEIEVILDRRGYTLETAMTTETRTFPQQTYESLETLLIAISPAYVQAMAREVGKRFEGLAGALGGEGMDRTDSQRKKEENLAEGGDQDAWK